MYGIATSPIFCFLPAPAPAIGLEDGMVRGIELLCISAGLDMCAITRCWLSYFLRGAPAPRAVAGPTPIVGSVLELADGLARVVFLKLPLANMCSHPSAIIQTLPFPAASSVFLSFLTKQSLSERLCRIEFIQPASPFLKYG